MFQSSVNCRATRLLQRALLTLTFGACLMSAMSARADYSFTLSETDMTRLLSTQFPQQLPISGQNVTFSDPQITVADNNRLLLNLRFADVTPKTGGSASFSGKLHYSTSNKTLLLQDLALVELTPDDTANFDQQRLQALRQTWDQVQLDAIDLKQLPFLAQILSRVTGVAVENKGVRIYFALI